MPFYDALCRLLRLPVGQIPTIPDTTVDTKAFQLLEIKKLAERVGFEPTLEFPLNTLSKRAPSATRPSLRTFALKEFYWDAAVGAIAVGT